MAEGANHTLQYYFATPGNPWDHAQVAGPAPPTRHRRSSSAPMARLTSWPKERTTPCSTTSPRPVTPGIMLRSPGPAPPTRHRRSSSAPMARLTSWPKERTTPCSTTSPRPAIPGIMLRSPGPAPPTRHRRSSSARPTRQAKPTSWPKGRTTPCSTTSPRPATPSIMLRSPGRHHLLGTVDLRPHDRPGRRSRHRGTRGEPHPAVLLRHAQQPLRSHPSRRAGTTYDG